MNATDLLLAEAGTLERLLRPRSVAIVGASEQPNKVGGRPLTYLREQGFAGAIYPVHPHATTVQGVPAFASLTALPEVPDAVILCVPSDQIEAELERCASLGVQHVVLFASGYAEVGGEGVGRQQQLLNICRQTGMRLVGPNSIGTADFASGAVLSFASIYADHPPLDGPIAIVSQSGAFGVAAYALLRAAGLGVRYVVATGNEADLDTADFIAELVSDATIRVVLLYLEGVKSDARLRAALEAARERGVAVIAVRAARSPEGRRSAGLHTASTCAGGAVLDELFEACGCRTVADLTEWVAGVPLYLAARAAPSPATPRVALISNSGASCVIAADAADALGLPLAVLAPDTLALLDACLPRFSLNRNPIDLTAMLLTDPALLGRVLTALLTDAGVDAASLGLVAIGGPSYDVARFARECRQAAQEAGKPLVVHSPHPHVRATFAQHGHAVFDTEAQALHGLRAHARHLHALNR